MLQNKEGVTMSAINIRLANITDLPEINQLYKEVVYDINNVKRINML